MPKAGFAAVSLPLAATLLLVLVAPRAGRAADGDDPTQDPGFPSIGARVRVTSSALPSGREVATLSGIDGESLALRLQDSADAVVIAPVTFTGSNGVSGRAARRREP